MLFTVPLVSLMPAPPSASSPWVRSPIRFPWSPIRFPVWSSVQIVVFLVVLVWVLVMVLVLVMDLGRSAVGPLGLGKLRKLAPVLPTYRLLPGLPPMWGPPLLWALALALLLPPVMRLGVLLVLLTGL